MIHQPHDEHGGVLATPFAIGGVMAVRHGQSTANVAFAEAARTGASGLPVDGSDADVPLSPQGQEQAAALGHWMAALAESQRPQLVVCSPYLRARQTWKTMAHTAATLSCTAPQMLVDERLRDREMGVFELHPPAAVEARAPEEAARRGRLGDWAYRPPGGEALADVAVRVRDFLTQLDRSVPGQRVLLVAHDAVVVTLRYVIAGIGTPVPDGVTPVPNASVSHWHGDGQHLRLASWGSITHLNIKETAV